METLSIVIPCYRSEATISVVVQEIHQTMKSRDFDNYEVILVSDASPDGVFEVIRNLAAQDKHIKGIELARNFGQHAALMAGYRHCIGDIIISMDDDGQTPANEIFSFVEKINEGYDVVYASYKNAAQAGYRRLGSALNKYMMERLLGKPKNIVANSYFACRRFIIEEMLRYEHSYPYLGGLVFRATKNIASIPVEHKYRVNGTSGYTFAKLVSLWVNGFTAFSVKPLRIATIIGSATAGIGFVVMLYTLINKFISPDVPLGYSSTMAAILFMGGMIMVLMGIIGEYVGRIYISINNAPQYVVRETVNLKTAEKKNK